MYILKFLSNFIEKKAWNDTLKMQSNSLPDADLNLPEMKIKSLSWDFGGAWDFGVWKCVGCCIFQFCTD